MTMDAMYHHQHKCFHLIVLKHENDFHSQSNVTGTLIIFTHCRCGEMHDIWRDVNDFNVEFLIVINKAHKG